MDTMLVYIDNFHITYELFLGVDIFMEGVGLIKY